MKARGLFRQHSGELSRAQPSRAFSMLDAIGTRLIELTTGSSNKDEGFTLVEDVPVTKSTAAQVGGTLNPIHNGHVMNVVFTRKLLQAEEVRVVPAFDPIHKRGKGLKESYHHRVKMTQLALNQIDGVSVDDSMSPSTYHDVVKMRLDFPDHCRVFVAGMDLLESFANGEWQGGPERYLSKTNILIIHRPGYELPDSEKVSALLAKHGVSSVEELKQYECGRIYVMTDPMEESLELSSTSVRDICMEYEPTLEDMVPEKVANYMRAHNLYGVNDEPNRAKETRVTIHRSRATMFVLVDDSNHEELQSGAVEKAMLKFKDIR